MKEACFYYFEGYCCCGNTCDHDKEDYENCEKYKEAVEEERKQG